MQISDVAKILNDEQKKLVLDTAVRRLKVSSLGSQVSLLKIVPGCPASEFEDDRRTIFVLHIQPGHFDKPNIEWILCHEVQHRVDDLNDSFGFDKYKRDRWRVRYGGEFTSIVAHLWDAYIDGRLDREGLYQIDPEGPEIDRKKRNRCTVRQGAIDFLRKRGICDAEQVYDRVWSAGEGELTYDQLAQLTLEAIVKQWAIHLT